MRVEDIAGFLHRNDIILEDLRFNRSSTLYELVRQRISLKQPTSTCIGLHDLARVLYLQGQFKGWEYPYYKVVLTIAFGISDPYIHEPDQSRDWQIAVAIGLLLMEQPGLNITEQVPIYARQDAVLSAIRRLQGQGYQFHAIDGHVTWVSGELERACQIMDAAVSAYGGWPLIRRIFERLHPHLARGRYVIIRHLAMAVREDKPLEIPWGYLLNLAAKHLKPAVPEMQSEERFESLLGLSKDIVATLDLEPYSGIEVAMVSPTRLIEALQDAVVGDACFSFEQLRPTDLFVMLETLFKAVDQAEMKRELGWTVADALVLAKIIFGPDTRPCHSFTFRKIRESTNLSNAVLRAMLDQFTHDPTQLNTEFFKPNDIIHRNLNFRPLVAGQNQNRLLIAPSISALGFYIALTDAIRSYDTHIDEKVGTAAEQLVSNLYIQHGLQPVVAPGFYAVSGERYECDIVLETNEYIFFLEIKKKILTRASFSGDVLEILTDLKSMFESQIQSGRHELYLRQNEALYFSDGTKLEFHGRRVVRISVSLLDWGTLQDPLNTGSFLQAFMQTNFGVMSDQRTSAADKKVNAVNNALNKLRTLESQLATFHHAGRPWLFDSLFVSIPWLMFLLDKCHGASAFEAKWRSFHAIRKPARNPYFQIL